MGPDLEVQAIIQEIAVPPPPGAPYAVPLPGTERPGRTPIYRHWRFKDKPLVETYRPNLRTFHDLFEDSATRFANNRCLGSRPWNAEKQIWEPKYVWQTYGEVAERRTNLGSGIVELHERIGVKGHQYGVGIWSFNRAEWQIADLALTSRSLYAVTLYETLGPDTTEYIINQTDLHCVISSLSHIPALLASASRCPTLKIIISVDPLDAGEPLGTSKAKILNEIAAQQGIEIWSFTDVEALGAQMKHPMRVPTPEDLLTINYTSGTTGDPKGVVITHRTAVAAISSGRTSGSITHRDSHLSYLPLAHIYGRVADQIALIEGAAIGYFHGVMPELLDDLKVLRPSGLISVPRLYNRIATGIKAQTIEAESPIRSALSRRAIDVKIASMNLPAGKATNKNMFYDSFWTPKVRKGVGLDRCHSMLSGSAQLDPDVHQFLRAATTTFFTQGYGLTESYAVASYQLRGDYSLGNVGCPVVGLEVCLESQPELEYLATDKPFPRGELLLKGAGIFSRYWKNEEETKKAIDPDGWFHTGDIALIDELGRIKIIDRKKNVLKLSQGEYVSPERIENVYMGSSNMIPMCLVHGDPSESSLVGVFGIDPETFAPFASKVLKKQVSHTDLDAVRAAAHDPRVVKAFIKHLDAIGKSHKFNGFEKVKNCLIEIEPFTVENDMMTPTLKVKRVPVLKAYRKDLDRLYAELKASTPTKAML